MAESLPKRPAVLDLPADSTHTTYAWRVVLINCECHTFDDVERQLLKAIRCTLSKARAIAWEVHTKGSSTVYSGVLERCEAVAACLEDIRLVVKVVQ
ncbi:MAG: ATP-dependent Clp protease adaptor ClpS [Elusimicrobia bacterium]|nr:ATP-dependent Clp protease adaptor ClpS [Elusimicrobiota bacterium]